MKLNQVARRLSWLLLCFLLPCLWPAGYSFPDIGRKLALGAVASVAAVVVKLHAVFLFLNSFPRLVGYSYSERGLLDAPILLWQLFGVRIFVGLGRWLPQSDEEFRPWITHREDVGYGLAAFAILALGLILLGRKARRADWTATRWKLALASAGWLCIECTLGSGFLWPLLKPLPFLRSLHENYRLAAVFALPLALCIAPCWAALTARCCPVWFAAATTVAAVAILSSVDPYMRINPLNYWFANYDLTPVADTSRELAGHSVEHLEIARVADVRDDLGFLGHASSWKPYEPIFGYGYGGPEFRVAFPPGPVERLGGDQADWRFHDPRPFLAPGLTADERFAPWSDASAADLKQLLARHQPDWPLSRSLKFSGALSLAALLFLLGGLTASLISALRKPSLLHPA